MKPTRKLLPISTKEIVYRVNNILQLLDICQSTNIDEELSRNDIISNEKRNTDYFTKTPYFKPSFQILKNIEEKQNFFSNNVQFSTLSDNTNRS